MWWPFWTWRPVEIFQCRESIRDIIIYPHIKFWWYRTMLNFWGIVAAILKMAISRNFSMLGMNSGHHYLPTYQILMISGNVEFLPPIFYTVFWQPFWKWQTSRILKTQNCSSNLVTVTLQINWCVKLGNCHIMLTDKPNLVTVMYQINWCVKLGYCHITN